MIVTSSALCGGEIQGSGDELILKIISSQYAVGLTLLLPTLRAGCKRTVYPAQSQTCKVLSMGGGQRGELQRKEGSMLIRNGVRGDQSP